jgi:hypothetical protein
MHYNLYTLPLEQEAVSGQNTWLEEGFKMTDELLKWCAANKNIFNFGFACSSVEQGKMPIFDYNPANHHFGKVQPTKDKMVALWEKLAERYKDNP